MSILSVPVFCRRTGAMMSNLKSLTWRSAAVTAIAFGGLVSSPLAAVAAEPAAATPTFTKDIAPIFQAKCESCHRPDSIAPMSLLRSNSTSSKSVWKSSASFLASGAVPPFCIIACQSFK